MPEPSPPEPSPPEPAPTEPAPRKRHPGVTLAKGCGCTTACVLLGVGIAVAGNGDVESWGSGVIGVLILIWVVGTSGTNGFFLSNK
jgi:hypothetical protein